jgi:outer membrane receptor protein involved in Fe transport
MLRAVTSRDVRAPNLSELFAAQVTRNNTVNVNGSVITVLEQTVGNTDLRPEIARNTEIGIVLSQPDWLPGFSASFDYFDITVDGVISTLTSQQEVDLCLAGNQELCAAMLLNSPIPNTNFVRVQAFNLAANDIQGFDVELQYRWESNFNVRALATHNKSFISDPGVVGTIPQQLAGVNLGSVPKWKGLVTESWERGQLGLNLTQRWISDGVYSNEWIECQTGCPNATIVHPTIDDNHMAGAFYLDLGATYLFGDKTMAYAKVDNALNKNPSPAPQTNVGYGANPLLYDIVGRMYRVGVRYNF